MRYTNNKGEQIEVSLEHIENAISIYEELKKLSPSGKVSWVLHKQIMEENGFKDSDSCEGYRSLVKRERYKRGIVPKNEDFKSDVLDNKKDAIKKIIGQMKVAQLEARNDFNTLNRAKREWSKDLIIAEVVEEAINNLDWSIFKPIKANKITRDDNKVHEAIVILSDLHYGFIGSNCINEYSPDIAKKLLENYLEKILHEILRNNIKRVHVINLGDLVEGILRNQSLFDTQKNLSKQAVAATDLILEFLTKLSSSVNVYYSGIAGNHDRLNPNKNDNIEGDSVMFMSNSIIEKISQYIPNLTYMPLQNEYYGVISMCGKNILAVHGDRTSIFKDSVLAEQSQVFGIDLDIIIAGHYHKYLVKEVSKDKYVSIFGSIKGSDDFSIRIGKTSSRSQGMIIFDHDGNFEIKQIKL